MLEFHVLKVQKKKEEDGKTVLLFVPVPICRVQDGQLQVHQPGPHHADQKDSD